MRAKLRVSINHAGMFIGGMTALFCLVREMQRHEIVGWAVLGGLAAWGALSTWNVIYDHKFQRDLAHEILKRHKLYPYDLG